MTPLIFEADTAAQAYGAALRHLLLHGQRVDPRALQTVELENAVIHVNLGSGEDGTYSDGTIKTPYKYLLTELAWYLSGERHPTMLEKIAPLWSVVKKQDGLVNSNYGRHIWYDVHPTTGMTQWQYCQEALLRDPNTRQAVIQIYGREYQVPGEKDVPCTSTIQFRIRNGVLNMTTHMRSNDIRRGLSFDLPFFIWLQHEMVRSLALHNKNLVRRPGTYTHIANSLHCYFPDNAYYAGKYGNPASITPNRFARARRLGEPFIPPSLTPHNRNDDPAGYRDYIALLLRQADQKQRPGDNQ